MKRVLVGVTLVALVVAVPAALAASASPKPASIVIRHQLRGCHTWSLNGGAYRMALTVRLARGGSLVITNNDPMVHQLIQQSGPAVPMRHIADGHTKMIGLQKINKRGAMNHMGARLHVIFTKAGVYRFTTEDLGDYFELKSVGMHNHLMLTVRVV